MNLILAVINQSFEKFQEEMSQNHLQKDQKMLTDGSSNDIPIRSLSIENELKNTNVFVFTDQKKKTKNKDKFLNKMKTKLKKILDSQFYLAFVTIVIILNTLFLALDHYPMTTQFMNMLNSANLAFTIFFFIEMLLKIFAMNISIYIKDKMNLFDMFIVFTSIIELILDYSLQISADNVSGISTISALRAFRLFRMFKILQVWIELKILIQALIESLITLKFFSILLFIFMVIAAFLGNELFAYRIRFINDTEIASILFYYFI